MFRRNYRFTIVKIVFLSDPYPIKISKKLEIILHHIHFYTS